MERRDAIKTAAAGVMVLSARYAITAEPQAEVQSTKVIEPSRTAYIGWPTLMRRKNGQLLLAASGTRESHVCPFGSVQLFRSNDEGKTWLLPQTIMDTPTDDRDAGILETASGTLLATTFTSNAYVSVLQQARLSGNWDAERLALWEAAAARITPQELKATLGTWVMRSTNGGITWSEAYSSIVNSPHGPIALQNGTIFYAGVSLWHEYRFVGVVVSRDDGKTWKKLAAIPTRTGDDSANYHELHAVEAPSGKIIVHVRNHNSTNFRETLQTESTDGGKTWTMLHSIGVWGLPSHLLRLRDGRLLMSYGYRRKPYGNQARISSDEGRTWSAPMTISDDGAGSDLGYTSTVELGDGKLLSVWYEKMAGSTKAVLRQAMWSIK
jgi:sialidase-1